MSVPLDEEIYEALRADADAQERTLSGHARFLITRQLNASGASPQP